MGSAPQQASSPFSQLANSNASGPAAGSFLPMQGLGSILAGQNPQQFAQTQANNLLSPQQPQTQQLQQANNILPPQQLQQANNVMPPQQPQANNILPPQQTQANNLLSPMQSPVNNTLPPQQTQANNILPPQQTQANNILPPMQSGMPPPQQPQSTPPASGNPLLQPQSNMAPITQQLQQSIFGGTSSPGQQQNPLSQILGGWGNRYG